MTADQPRGLPPIRGNPRMSNPRPSASYHFTLPLEVRDYECDQQGIVNNAVYQHYLEHARHQLLKRHGISFAELTKRGIHVVVVRAEIDYKAPLRTGDAFVVGVNVAKLSPVRIGFLQDIRRTSQTDKPLILTSTFVCAAMDVTGKPIFPTALDPLLNACGVA